MLSLVYMINSFLPISTVKIVLMVSFTGLIFSCMPAGAGHGDEKREKELPTRFSFLTESVYRWPSFYFGRLCRTSQEGRSYCVGFS